MNKKHTGAKVAAGIGLGLAAAAGALFFYGKEGAKNRKAVKSWAMKARAEVLEQVEKMKRFDEKDFHKVVDSVMKRYAKTKKASAKELASLGRELKAHWKDLRKHVK